MIDFRFPLRRPAGWLLAAVALVPSIAVGQSSTDDTEPTGALQAIASRDLDGDGLDDLITIASPEWQPLDSSRLSGTATARSGRSGAALWTRRLTAASVIPLELGATTDVLILDAPTPYGPHAVTLVGGSDGSTRWTLPLPSVGAGGPMPYQGASIDEFGWASGMPDATGDDRRDVFVTTGGIASADVEAQLFFSTGRILDGVTGRLVAIVEGVSDQRFTAPTFFPLVHPTPDLDGDGLANVLAIRRTRASSTISLLDLRGQPIWSAPIASALGTIELHDLTGDGTVDVLVKPTVLGGPQIAYEGRSGRLLWSEPVRHAALLAVGDIDRDGGIDLRFATPFDIEFGNHGMHVGALSGTDGRILWERRLTLEATPEDDTLAVRCCWLRDDDLDGDGIVDTLVHTVRYGHCCPRALATRTEALDGRTGRSLWSTDSYGLQPATALRPLAERPQALNRRGDLDGDGAGDLLLPSDPSGQQAFVRGIDLQPMWTLPFAWHPETMLVGADLRSDAGLEIIATIGLGEQVVAVGHDGILWSVSAS